MRLADEAEQCDSEMKIAILHSNYIVQFTGPDRAIFDSHEKTFISDISIIIYYEM